MGRCDQNVPVSKKKPIWTRGKPHSYCTPTSQTGTRECRFSTHEALKSLLKHYPSFKENVKWLSTVLRKCFMEKAKETNRNKKMQILHSWGTEVTSDWNTTQVFLKKMLLNGSAQCLENVLRGKPWSSTPFVYQKEVTSQAFISITTARKNKKLSRPLAEPCQNSGPRETHQKTEKTLCAMKRNTGY